MVCIGSSYDRERESRDDIVDDSQWTLPEKEQFPYYFNRREQRKKELLQHWTKIEKVPKNNFSIEPNSCLSEFVILRIIARRIGRSANQFSKARLL